MNKQLERERKTIKVMIGMYCRKYHNKEMKGCETCTELFSYASKKLDCCTFRNDKPVCSKCPIHCYKPEMREKIKTVMRYSGPRMIFQHPVLAFYHTMHGKNS